MPPHIGTLSFSTREQSKLVDAPVSFAVARRFFQNDGPAGYPEVVTSSPQCVIPDGGGSCKQHRDTKSGHLDDFEGPAFTHEALILSEAR